MIDYNKLKEAHEVGCEGHYYISVELGHLNGVYYNVMSKANYGASCLETKDFDEALNKLKELTIPEPRYNVGQEVFFVDDNKLSSEIISEIRRFGDINLYYLRTHDDEFTMGECLLYPSREALIEAQLKYWRKLLNETGCHHEHTLTSGFACVKCGENLIKDEGADSEYNL